ncbi:MAG: type I restriction enzyme HsdR N-terminal domain-containing protein [Bacteroidota bacterium]
MHPLKLPGYKPKIRTDKRSDIFCLIRKKYVALTPEEWVRQHFLNLLIEHLGYPKGMIRLEYTLSYFKKVKRSDITVLNRDGTIFLLVECKSYDLPLGQQVMNQIAAYNKVLDADYLAITNGLKHYTWEKKETDFHQINHFPNYLDV